MEPLGESGVRSSHSGDTLNGYDDRASVTSGATTPVTTAGTSVEEKVKQLVNRDFPVTRQIGHFLGRPIIQHRRSQEFSEMLKEGMWDDAGLSDDQKKELTVLKKQFDNDEGKSCVTDLKYFHKLQEYIVETLKDKYKTDPNYTKHFGDPLDESQIKSIFQEKIDFLFLVEKGRKATDEKTQTVAERVFAPLFSLANAIFKTTRKVRSKAADDVQAPLKAKIGDVYASKYVQAAKEFANGKGKVIDDPETYYEALEQHLFKETPATSEPLASLLPLSKEEKKYVLLWLVEKPKMDAKVKESIHKQPVLQRIIPEKLIKGNIDLPRNSNAEVEMDESYEYVAMSDLSESSISETDTEVVTRKNQFINNKLREVAIDQLKKIEEITVNDLLQLKGEFIKALSVTDSFGPPTLTDVQKEEISSYAVSELLITSLGIDEDVALKIMEVEDDDPNKIKDLKLVNLNSASSSWLESLNQSRIARARISKAKDEFLSDDDKAFLKKFAEGPGKAYKDDREFYAAFINYAGYFGNGDLKIKAGNLYNRLSLQNEWSPPNQSVATPTTTSSRRSSVSTVGSADSNATFVAGNKPQAQTTAAPSPPPQESPTVGTADQLPPQPGLYPATTAREAPAPTGARVPPSPARLAEDLGLKLPTALQIPHDLKEYENAWIKISFGFPEHKGKNKSEIDKVNEDVVKYLKNDSNNISHLRYPILKILQDNCNSLIIENPPSGVVQRIFLAVYQEAYLLNEQIEPRDQRKSDAALREKVAIELKMVFNKIGCKGAMSTIDNTIVKKGSASINLAHTAALPPPLVPPTSATSQATTSSSSASTASSTAASSTAVTGQTESAPTQLHHGESRTPTFPPPPPQYPVPPPPLSGAVQEEGTPPIDSSSSATSASLIGNVDSPPVIEVDFTNGGGGQTNIPRG